jgi:hypothetical protein
MQDGQLLVLVRYLCAMSILGPLAALAIHDALRALRRWLSRVTGPTAPFHDVE